MMMIEMIVIMIMVMAMMLVIRFDAGLQLYHLIVFTTIFMIVLGSSLQHWINYTYTDIGAFISSKLPKWCRLDMEWFQRITIVHIEILEGEIFHDDLNLIKRWTSITITTFIIIITTFPVLIITIIISINIILLIIIINIITIILIISISITIIYIILIIIILFIWYDLLSCNIFIKY